MPEYILIFCCPFFAIYLLLSVYRLLSTISSLCLFVKYIFLKFKTENRKKDHTNLFLCCPTSLKYFLLQLTQVENLCISAL